MSPRDGSRRRVLTQDERVLWTIVTKSIEPLREAAMIDADIDEVEAPARAAKSSPAKSSPAKSSAAKSSSAKTSPAKPAAPPMLSPKPLAPLGRRMKQRVARGREAIDARLDLHGLTQAQAHATLSRFLHDASARGARLVLVITGKGRGGEPGVLRRQVPQWLALPEFRSLVIGFEDAHIAHGGEGALYVRVRRASRE
jgi:DNA-nicking Smr family endonuclease